jgi:hypothetical protein
MFVFIAGHLHTCHLKAQVDDYDSFLSFSKNIKNATFLSVNMKNNYNILMRPEFSKVKIKIRTTNSAGY